MFQLTLLLDAPADTVIQVRILRPAPPTIIVPGESAPETPGLVKAPSNVVQLSERRAS